MNTDTHPHSDKHTPPHLPTRTHQHPPQSRVDLQGLAQHLGPRVFQTVPTEIDLPQPGIGAQGVHQHRAPLTEPGVSQGQGLQGLGEGRGERLSFRGIEETDSGAKRK